MGVSITGINIINQKEQKRGIRSNVTLSLKLVKSDDPLSFLPLF